MVSVNWDPKVEQYIVTRRGMVKSRHNKAARAKEAGKRLGRKFNEPVSYNPKTGSTRFIFKPEPKDQFL